MFKPKVIGFWLAALVLLALVYGSALGSYVNATFLALLLMPGAIFINWRLPYIKQLNGLKKWFHIFYMLVISLYLEWMAMIVAYWLLYEFNVSRVPKILVNPVYLWMWMFFFALARERLFPKKVENISVEKPEVFELTSSGKKVKINLESLRYIESKNEMCYLHLDGKILDTRERISKLEERLPAEFIRIHRSFIVNMKKAHIMGTSEVLVGEQLLPISRSYKAEVSKRFEKETD